MTEDGLTTEEARYREALGQRIDGDQLAARDRFFAALHEGIFAWLDIMPGTAALDAGCGAGGCTVLLARDVGEGGSVAALDIAPALLETTRAHVEATPYASRVAYYESDITAVPFDDATFDLVWCSRVIHDLPDPLAGLRELRRVLKPGGRLVMLEDIVPPRLLPFYVGLGRPGLEDRVNVAFSYRFAAFRRSLPGSVRYAVGWTQMLRDAGLADVSGRSFLFELMSPFTESQEAYLLAHLRASLDRPRVLQRLDPKDQLTLQRLTDPEGPFYVFNRKDLHFIHVSTVYTGRA